MGTIAGSSKHSQTRKLLQSFHIIRICCDLFWAPEKYLVKLDAKLSIL